MSEDAGIEPWNVATLLVRRSNLAYNSITIYREVRDHCASSGHKYDSGVICLVEDAGVICGKKFRGGPCGALRYHRYLKL